jgi:hypothetical protein
MLARSCSFWSMKAACAVSLYQLARFATAIAIYSLRSGVGFCPLEAHARIGISYPSRGDFVYPIVSSVSMQSLLRRSTSSSRRLAAKPISRSFGRLCRRLPMPKS